jgi:hypothetical protein
MNKTINFNALVKHFKFKGEFIYEEVFGCGHINDTFAVYFKIKNEHPVRYILQRINHNIFKNPIELMQNIKNVTEHIKQKVKLDGGNALRETLTIIETKDNKLCFIDEEGNYWRAYVFIDDATCYQIVENPVDFYKSGKAFGKFQRQLSDFPAHTLFETIPDFHNTKKRFEAFLKAVNKDLLGRASTVKEEIAFVLEREEDTGVLVNLFEEGLLPLRVTHNDTKLNNVMIDNETGEGICVVDLDTVMPGLSLYDFGDSIRFGASTAAEDEKDLSKVHMDIHLFEQFTKGFLEEAGRSLTHLEIKYLPIAAKIMTLECGMRFLTDYLNGDTYFKIHREGQNLDRCRTQFKLVSEMEEKMHSMKEIINNYKILWEKTI